MSDFWWQVSEQEQEEFEVAEYEEYLDATESESERLEYLEER